MMNIFHFPAFNVPPPDGASNREPELLPDRSLQYSEEVAVVERAIIPSYKGRIKYQGVSWLAQCEKNLTFYPGDRVLVVDRRHITLIVEPLPSINYVPASHL